MVALGKFGYQVICNLMNIKPVPQFGHGVTVPIPESKLGGKDFAGGHIVSSYHPSQQNTFTGRLTEQMLDDVFIAARELAGLPLI